MEGVRAMTNTEELARRLGSEVLAACEQRRRRLGLSYAELARRMGVSRAYVSKLMSGGAGLSIRSLTKLAATLDSALSVSLKAEPPYGKPAVIVRSTDAQ